MEYTRQIEALEDSKLHLYEQYQLQEICLDAYKAEKTKLDEQLLKVKNAFAVFSAQWKSQQEAKDKEDHRRSIKNLVVETTSLTSELANLLIDKVRVYPGCSIEIVYKVQDLFE